MSTTIQRQPPMTKDDVMARLGIWREHLIEAKTSPDSPIALQDIRRELDRLLDDLTWLTRRHTTPGGP